MTRWRTAGAAVLACAALAGCGGGDTVKGPPPKAPATLRLTSPAFADGGTIPRRFSCDGDNLSPPLRWAGVPAGAKALALVVEDPDAPGGTFVHWVLLDLPPTTASLATGATPAGAVALANSSGDRGYAGPCPPHGDEPHHYDFRLYALKAPLHLGGDASAEDARAAIAGAALAGGRLTGRYGR